MQLDLFEQFSTSRNAGLELHELFEAYTDKKPVPVVVACGAVKETG